MLMALGIMVIRTIALYNQNKFIICLLSLLMMAQTVMLTTFTAGEYFFSIIQLNYKLHSCQNNER